MAKVIAEARRWSVQLSDEPHYPKIPQSTQLYPNPSSITFRLIVQELKRGGDIQMLKSRIATTE